MPRTSIIIATRNRPQFVSRAVDSARASGKDVEVIVVDDASSEETAKVCDALADITYIRVERRLGLGGARNVGMVSSRGEYISFLDDDDLRLEGTLDQQIELLEKEPSAGLIYARANVTNTEGGALYSYPTDCLQGDLFWKLLTQNFIPCGSVVFRRSCLSRIGLLDDDSPGIEDWDLWVRIAELYPITSLRAPVIVWRKSTPTSGQLTSQAAQIVTASIRQFRRWMKLPRALGASREMKQTAWHGFSENMAEHLLCECLRALRHGKLDQPLKNLSLIPRLDPLTVMRLARHRFLRLGGPDLQTL